MRTAAILIALAAALAVGALVLYGPPESGYLGYLGFLGFLGFLPARRRAGRASGQPAS